MATTPSEILRTKYSTLNSQVRMHGEFNIEMITLFGYNIPEHVKVPTDEDGAASINYACTIESNGDVYIVIGDYIIAKWNVFDKDMGYTFENQKGYGPDHWMSFIDQLPINLVYKISAEFFIPRMFR